MPRLTNSTPKYRKHRKSGQAIVTLCGKDFYLGPHGTQASRREYDRIVAEWLQNGRKLTVDSDEIMVTELAARYWQFAKGYYTKDGKDTCTAGIKIALRFLRKLYGHTPAVEFGPLALKAVRQSMVDDGQSRRYVNDNIDRIKRMFRWAAAEQLVPPSVPQALSMVPGLRKGRTEAHENSPVLPVDEITVDETLPHLSPIVADMVRFQRLTGCRPAEVCVVRPMDVDSGGDVWKYRPESHKTEHHGRERAVFIGPQAQDVLRPYLLRSAESYCFSPRESEKQRLDSLHDQRKTPLAYGNRPGSNRKRKPKRTAGDRYNTGSYRRAIHRAVESANKHRKKLASQRGREIDENGLLEKWSPNRLRHSAATEIRKRFGLEAAQVALGHASADVSQIYAERDFEKAA